MQIWLNFFALRIKGNHQVWQIVAHFEQARSRTLWNALKHQLVEQVQPDYLQLLCWTWHMLFIMVRPTSAKTFADCATQHIVPFLEYQITTTVERIDAI